MTTTDRHADRLLTLTPAERKVWSAMLGVFSRATVTRSIIAASLTGSDHPDIAEIIACCRRIEPTISLDDIVDHAQELLFSEAEDRR